MKIKNKTPKVDEQKHRHLIANSWTPIREPENPVWIILISIPFMVLNALVVIGVLKLFSTFSLSEFGISFPPESIVITVNLGVLFLILMMIVVHELLHLVFVPGFMKSNKTFIGLTWFGGYVMTEEVLSRGRFMLITAAPFVTLSVLLPIVLSLLGILTPVMKALILLNAIASSVDALSFLLLVTKVPRNTVLIHNGTKTYWKYKIEQQA
ncbi:DUF3267 domain-containing protein [Halobacillus fulvus]|nr:DUF3267 domain-containing protein [Halobacillus fulvus]